MMLLGMLWAAFAPLSLFIFIWILDTLSRKMSVPERFGVPLFKAQKFRRLCSAAIVFGMTALLWLPQKMKFSQICADRGEPTIVKKENAIGFFLDDSTANSFGMRYLQEEGFQWIEARSIYNRDKFTRYEKVGDKITQKEIDTLSAEYVVQSVFKEEGFFSSQQITVARRDTGEKLAWANSMNFDGGTAKWVLGAWGSASCPSAMSNSDAFTKMYHLAKHTLNSGTVETK